jgi:hypothetical protein
MWQLGDVVEGTFYIWNPLRSWMMGGWEEVGKRRFKVIAELDIFDRDYPRRLEELKYEYPDAEVVGYERKIFVLVPVTPFMPKQ